MNQVLINNEYQLIESLLGKRDKSTVDGEAIITTYLNTIENENTRKKYKRSIYEWFDYWYQGKHLTLDMMVKSPFHATRYMQPFRELVANKQMKKSTYNAKITGIKSFYKWFITNTIINESHVKLMLMNPFESIKVETEDDKEGSDFLTPEEVLLMINNPIGHGTHMKTRNQLILELAITTAIRSNALIQLTLEEIKEFNNDIIISKPDKNNKMTDKPINDIYVRLMKWYEDDLMLREDDRGTIFNICTKTATNMIMDWVASVGIKKKITFHGLRATSGILVYHQSGDNKTHAQYFMQHTDGKTTDIYLKKENPINHDGENAYKSLREGCKFDEYVDGLSKEEAIEMLKALDLNTKMQIMRKKEQG